MDDDFVFLSDLEDEDEPDLFTLAESLPPVDDESSCQMQTSINSTSPEALLDDSDMVKKRSRTNGHCVVKATSKLKSATPSSSSSSHCSAASSTIAFSAPLPPILGTIDPAVAATQALRNSSMHLLQGLTSQSLESFRNAFFGGCMSDDEDDDEDEGNDKKRKRTKRPNPDADLIASVTDEQMRLNNFDSNSKEGKKQRRKIRNRMSALLHRERKKMYIEALESMVREKDTHIKQLEMELLISSAARKSPGSITGSNMTDEDSSISSASFPTTRCNSPASYRLPFESSSSIQLVSGSLRGLLPVLSIICLLCLAAFEHLPRLPDHKAGDVHDNAALTMSSVSILEVPQLNQLALPPVVLIPPPHPDLQIGRKLLELDDWENGTFIDYDFLSTRNSALWKYSQNVATLYPRFNSLSTNTTAPPKKQVRHLRSREASTSSVTKDNYSKELIQAPIAQLPIVSVPQVHDPPSLHSAVTSRILMTAGKALLDPSLTIAQEPRVPASSTARATSFSSALSAWQTPVYDTHSPPRKAPVIVSTTDSQQVLMLLLPSSSVRWGKIWADSEGGTTETIMSMLNETSRDSTYNGNGDSAGDDEYPMWVEIGCSVFKAQLVRNVTIVDG